MAFFVVTVTTYTDWEFEEEGSPNTIIHSDEVNTQVMGVFTDLGIVAKGISKFMDGYAPIPPGDPDDLYGKGPIESIVVSLVENLDTPLEESRSYRLEPTYESTDDIRVTLLQNLVVPFAKVD